MLYTRFHVMAVIYHFKFWRYDWSRFQGTFFLVKGAEAMVIAQVDVWLL